MPNAEDFEQAIRREWAANAGRHYVDINAGELHRKVGGYPGSSHRMPICCEAMKKLKSTSDVVLDQPPNRKQHGARLTIRYSLPRP